MITKFEQLSDIYVLKEKFKEDLPTFFVIAVDVIGFY